jgi:hypothetical protein
LEAIDATTEGRNDGLPRPNGEAVENTESQQPEQGVITPFAYPNCDAADITIGNYTISACNVGATTAGTGTSSYGSLFQRGNNYPFSNSVDPTFSMMTVDTSTY